VIICNTLARYVLAEALGDSDSHASLQLLLQCEAAQPLLTFTAELRSHDSLTHSHARHVLGTVFLHGSMGFCTDYDAALALFGRAAAANFAPAQSSLVRHARCGGWGGGVGARGGGVAFVIRVQGLMLVRGIGRERDNQRGCVLLATAAAAGDSDAHFFLGCCRPSSLN
jgi:TPR repeat protein